MGIYTCIYIHCNNYNHNIQFSAWGWCASQWHLLLGAPGAAGSLLSRQW